MADQCVLCRIVDGTVPAKKIYEDDEVIAILDFNGANPGHSFVIPKQHIPILEQIPPHLVGKLFNTANKISSAIFDALKVQGTNIFLANGIPAGQKVAHSMINVIPRKENDGINLQWQTKQLSEEEMSTIELKLKEESSNIGIPYSEAEKSEGIRKEKTQTISGEDNYLLKSLRRIP